MVEQILKEEKDGVLTLTQYKDALEHKKQLGLRLRVLYKLLRKSYPEMLRLP